MALQFPLLFIYGEDGYSKEMKMVSIPGTPSDEDRRLTMKAYYLYMLHDRVREHQNDIRNDYLSGIYDTINREDSDGSDCDGRLILPQSFASGPRYITAREKLLDEEVPLFNVRLYSVVGAREYELPIRDTLGAIFYESGPDTDMDYDIVIKKRIGQP
nr:nucleic acid-binding, OB-fold protein [Tanacetum cinerariifolium]